MQLSTGWPFFMLLISIVKITETIFDKTVMRFFPSFIETSLACSYLCIVKSSVNICRNFLLLIYFQAYLHENHFLLFSIKL